MSRERVKKYSPQYVETRAARIVAGIDVADVVGNQQVRAGLEGILTELLIVGDRAPLRGVLSDDLRARLKILVLPQQPTPQGEHHGQ